MTPILAKVLAVQKQGDEYRVAVRIGLATYTGAFSTLDFGDHKPVSGSCHEGRLDLLYHRNPGVRAGEPFPLWTEP